MITITKNWVLVDCIFIVVYEMDTHLRSKYHFSPEILLFKHMQNGLSWEMNSHSDRKKNIIFRHRVHKIPQILQQTTYLKFSGIKSLIFLRTLVRKNVIRPPTCPFVRPSVRLTLRPSF